MDEHTYAAEMTADEAIQMVLKRPEMYGLQKKVDSESVARLQAVERAWRDEGGRPDFHREVKGWLAMQWPTLHTALSELMEE